MTGKRLAPLVVCFAAVFLLAWQSGGRYDLSWWTVDGGGYTFSSGGGFQVGGTVGQPDAGVLSSGGYVLDGGFWRGGAATSPPRDVYLPLVLK
jgi:hypothetical protein